MGGQNQNVVQNDKSPLLIRVAIESSAAIISAFTVAPMISIVDKAIVSNASGKEPLIACLMNGCKVLVTNPIYFLKQPSFLFIWGVYSGTYIVANSVEALCERNSKSSFYPKFIGSSIANVSLSVLKDKAFARMFGVGDPKPFPMTSLGLFAVRDSMTILASFSLPSIIASSLQKSHNWSESGSYYTAQLGAPVAMQVLSTPLHLYGLDNYNRTGSVSTDERLKFIKKEYIKTTLARMARIFPAFGIGGVVNKKVRASGKEVLSTMYT